MLPVPKVFGKKNDSGTGNVIDLYSGSSNNDAAGLWREEAYVSTSVTATAVWACLKSSTGFWAIAIASATLLSMWVMPTVREEIPSYRVAFIGNSLTFTNDLPRFMAALADATLDNGQKKHLVQNSCLHSSLSFHSFLQRGNGMYHKWQTPNALLVNISASHPFPYYEDSLTMIVSDDQITTYKDDDGSNNNNNNQASAGRTLVYDYGACTVRQLLFGYDDTLVEGNSNGKYINDGANPCLQDSNYLHYLQAKYYEQKIAEDGSMVTSTKHKFRKSLQTKWDFVVMNDQSVYPGIVSKRNRSLRALTKRYATMFLKSKTAVPVFLATYGYMKSMYSQTRSNSNNNNYKQTANNYKQSSNTYKTTSNKYSSRTSGSFYKSNKYGNANNNDVTDDDVVDFGSNDDVTEDEEDEDVYYDPTYDVLGDMTHFTSRIWYGYQRYAEELGKLLPSHQKPIVAPVGPAFLLLYEENYNMWYNQMFYDDGYHPSPHGTFLIGCILYATLYGRMPSSNIFTSTDADESYSNSGSSANYYADDDSSSSSSPTLKHLWKFARRMQMSDMGSDRPFPTVEEAMYLMNLAERVVLLGALPKSLLTSEQVQAMEDAEASASDDNLYNRKRHR